MRGRWESGNKTSSLKSISLTKFLPVTFQRSCIILLESKCYASLCKSWGHSGAHPEWISAIPQVPSVLSPPCWCAPSSCWDAQHMEPYCHVCSHPLKPSWGQVPSEYPVTSSTFHSPCVSQRCFSPGQLLWLTGHLTGTLQSPGDQPQEMLLCCSLLEFLLRKGPMDKSGSGLVRSPRTFCLILFIL